MKRILPLWLVLFVVVIGLSYSARADAPLVFCECVGGTCGWIHRYVYPVDSATYPMMEFMVGTGDLDATNYSNVLIPPGWSFTVEDVGMTHACGLFARHGELSQGPCFSLTAGRVRWWTDDPVYAVEVFTFGFDHLWWAEDVGWTLVTRREGPPPQYYTFTEWWDSPVGMGEGPLHGPYAPIPHRNLHLGPEEIIFAALGAIYVPGWSVPSFVHWDGDDLKDLVVGEGGGTSPGQVRIYLNVGEPSNPVFFDFFYAQLYGGGVLSVPPQGCLGAFPRVVYWDGDARKDLIIGQADGKVKFFRNLNTDDDPLFDEGTFLQVGEPGFKLDINVGARATPAVADWNSDGRKDLVVGALDGLIHVFIDEGIGLEPDFRIERLAEMDGGALLQVPTERSSPTVRDLDDDGRKDLLTGNTEGQLLFYKNTGSNEAPVFTHPVQVRSSGVPIDLPDEPRSRPFLCDWTADGRPDVLIGSGDGLVHLYQGLFELGDLNCDGMLNAFDIDPFVLALTDPQGYAAQYPHCDRMLADCNCDEEVNAFDIDPFVELLTGP